MRLRLLHRSIVTIPIVVVLVLVGGMLVALNVTHHGFGGVGATGGKSCTSGQDAFNLNNMPLLTYVA